MERALQRRLEELERLDERQHVSAYDVRYGIEAEAIRRQLQELKTRPPRPPAVPRPEAQVATPRTNPEADAEAVVRGVLPPLLELVEEKAAARHSLMERALALIEKQGDAITRLEATVTAAEVRYAALEARLEENTRAAAEAVQCSTELAERLDAETAARVALQADMALVRERAIAVEARTMSWAPTFVRNHEGHLIVTQPDGSSRDLGRVDGDKGERGSDGVGFDAIDASIINERTICLSIGSADGLRQKEIQFPLPLPIFRGFFKENTAYDVGDLVHHGGHLWHCDTRTGEMPTEKSKTWSIAARRGRDGREGPAGPQGERGLRGEKGDPIPVYVRSEG